MKQGISIELNNVNSIFEEAIEHGILSSVENDENYVGMFMYMYTKDETGTHFFKHKETRKYGFDKSSIIDACKTC